MISWLNIVRSKKKKKKMKIKCMNELMNKWMHKLNVHSKIYNMHLENKFW